MISICIPIYNFDVRPLVGQLFKEIQSLNNGCEIICIDDDSDDYFKNINGNFCDKCGEYVQLYENIGRAKIRNLFLKYAANDYLLFLDCDSIVANDNFVSNYLMCLSDKPNVVCGGRVYPPERPETHFLLRWKYGHKRESKPASLRKRKPHKSFMTNNFVIHKSVLLNIQFEERISKYGHEDTLYGFMLHQNGIMVVHTDNSILNGELETNAEFLAKSDMALENLAFIIAQLNENREFVSNVTILRWYYRLKAFKLLFIVSLMHALFLKCFRKKLISGKACIRVFDMYKLILFDKFYKKFFSSR